MVTVGRVLFAALERRVPSRTTYHILPFVLVGTFLLAGALTRPHAAAGIAMFALAGLGCSALLPLTISFGQGDLTAIAAAMPAGSSPSTRSGTASPPSASAPCRTRRQPVSDLRLHRSGRRRDGTLSFFVVRRRPAPAGVTAAEPGLP